MSAELRESKRRLRRQMSQRRRLVPKAEAERVARIAAQSLIRSAPAARAHRIALYAALPDELPSRPLFDSVVDRCSQVLLPRTAEEDRLEFFPVTRWEELQPGCYGVLEPPPEGPPELLAPDDLVVVPGVAFDSFGNRLGRGKGCYDRTFASGSGPILIGFGYEFQVIEAVPHEAGDRRMDAIVTECAVRTCGEPLS